MIMNYDSEDYKKKLLLKTSKFKGNKDVIRTEYTLYNNILTKWQIMNEGNLPYFHFISILRLKIIGGNMNDKFPNQEKKNVKKIKQQPKKKVIVMVPTINLILVMYNQSVKRQNCWLKLYLVMIY